MDFPEINIISDFEAGVKCLQNPSLISRSFLVPQAYSFWKWGALVLAILATFSSLIRKVKLLFIQIRKMKPCAEPLLQYLGEDFDISDDDDDCNDDQCSSASAETDANDDPLLFDMQKEKDFRVAGSSFYFKEKGQHGHLRYRRRINCLERFPWTEFSAGKNVVKLWDSLALGLDYEYEDLSNSVVSLWDWNEEEKVPAVAMGSPAVILSTEKDRNGIVLAAYDIRMKSETPAICADWVAGKVVGVDSSGVGKVYVRDEIDGVLTVGDMRNVKTPLERLTEIDGDDTWWDADAVIVEEKFDG
ncbi:unnamed protein product [Withania somnifera]